jgi:hypothetical protein
MIDCKENEDGSFTIYWDENDPIERILNDWTPEDFIKVITNYAEEIISQEEYINIKKKVNTTETGGESQDSNITEATKKDWEDFWNSESEGKELNYESWEDSFFSPEAQGSWD